MIRFVLESKLNRYPTGILEKIVDLLGHLRPDSLEEKNERYHDCEIRTH